MPDVVLVKDATVRFADGRALHFAGELRLRRGERLALLGGNGSGKTTLFRLITGLLPPDSGTVFVFDLEPSRHFAKIRDRLALLMQDVNDQLLAPTVAEDVAFAPRNKGWPEPEISTKVSDTLDRVGLEPQRDRIIHDLSGGDRVKVALAGALAADPELLLLDEPFEHQDPAAKRDVVAIVNDLANKGVAVILSTHQIDLVPQVADRVMVLAHGGAMALEGSPQELFAQPERLAELRIEPPILGALFSRLAALGLEIPATVSEAAEILERALSRTVDQGRMQ